MACIMGVWSPPTNDLVLLDLTIGIASYGINPSGTSTLHTYLTDDVINWLRLVLPSK